MVATAPNTEDSTTSNTDNFYCPTKEEYSISNHQRRLDVLDGQFTWWYCMECQTWHLATNDLEHNPAHN